MSTAQTSYIPQSLSSFPHSSRIWLFGFERELSLDEMGAIAEALNAFIDSWNCHGSEVKGTFAVIEGRFLMVIAREDVSGCSKDSLMRTLASVEERMGMNILSGLRFFYRDDRGHIHAVDRSDVSRLIRTGTIGKETTVFNLALTTFGQLHGGLFELPLKNSVFNSYLARAS